MCVEAKKLVTAEANKIREFAMFKALQEDQRVRLAALEWVEKLLDECRCRAEKTPVMTPAQIADKVAAEMRAKR